MEAVQWLGGGIPGFGKGSVMPLDELGEVTSVISNPEGGQVAIRLRF